MTDANAVYTTNTQQALEHAAVKRFRDSIACVEQFFNENAGPIAAACEQLAHRFRVGGRLFVFGSGPSTSDAQHVSVEFVHPVLVGKRALPAVALTTDSGSFMGTTSHEGVYADQMRLFANESDIALGITSGTIDPATANGLLWANTMGLLTFALAAEPANDRVSYPPIDHFFVIPTNDPLVAQEVQETLYHVLWELVHVFLDRGGPSV